MDRSIIILIALLSFIGIVLIGAYIILPICLKAKDKKNIRKNKKNNITPQSN
ncbi:hypothetical protein [Spiroplasma endosymbiont of Virgichneumon dumeticola]|uniref:hypothetical protein n=1 Tax=Spiroplasma endosymbiont of Virgichneumon dumeticola TaxID=3139323 RepID=UPI0035C901CD